MKEIDRGLSQSWSHIRIATIQNAFTPDYHRSINQTIEILKVCFQEGHKLLVCGNGGSASDAQHIVAELVGRFQMHRPGLPAIALATNPSTLTAWSNDCTFDTVFSRQVEALGRSGDVLWAISTSGKSKNVLQALQAAKANGLVTIGLAGNQGGEMQPLVDYPLFVDQQQTSLVQEIHLITYHRICEQIELQLFRRSIS